MPNIFRIQKELRQKELDSKAETIYVAVQNKLSKMKAAGDTRYNVKNEKGVNGPSQGTNVFYFTSSDKNTDAYVSNIVMSGDVVIDASLYNNNWVVEYDPANAVVYSVFYSESKVNVATLIFRYLSPL